LFSFTEQWLNPDLPLAHCLFVSFGLMVALHPVKILLEKRAAEMTTAFAVGAFRLNRTAIADVGVRSLCYFTSSGVGLSLLSLSPQPSCH
jgi:hypothetical protein